MPNASFNIQLQGFPAANRDAVVSLVSEATGQRIERKPFLDGSLLVRDLNPGFYELEVRHPNLISAIDKRRIRLFPQVPPTKITVLVPPDLFRDTPIRDIPDIDLTPIRQAASAAKDSLTPLAGKIAGEAIKASDWNTLVGAVASLADAMVQLTQSVSPTGHNHPELEEKFDEVQGNIRRFSEAFGRSLLELQRQIETENLRRNVNEMLDLGAATNDQRTRVLGRLDDLVRASQVDTPQYTQKTSILGDVLLNTVSEMAIAQGGNADTFLANPVVQSTQAVARGYSEAGVQTKPEAELLTYQRTSAAAGGSKVGNIVRR